jgi:hypothetical protein
MWWSKFAVPMIGTLLLACFSQAEESQHFVLADETQRLEFLTSKHWKTEDVGGRKSLVLDVPGKQRPPVRRPGEYALWNQGQQFKDYSLTLEACSLELASKKGRDVCILFGYQDDTHFYYAHISNDSNGTFHNVIMKVEGDSRTRINLEVLPEPRLPDGWRTVRVSHRSTGDIKVWVDEMDVPLMTADDSTYSSGGIGFGSFDDRAAFRTLEIVVK